MSDLDGTLSDDLLHEVCRISPDDEGYSADLLADLRCVAALADKSRARNNDSLQHAIALLTSVLGKLPKYHVMGPPSSGWVDREEVESSIRQIAGLATTSAPPGAVAVMVANAMSEAVRLSLVKETERDTWKKGMASGSGWKAAVSATPYGVTKARSASSGDGSTQPKAPAKGQVFFLVTSPSTPPRLSRHTVFYKTADAATAESLCRLFVKEYGTNGGQHHFAVASGDGVSAEDQILLDETLVELELYDDPDPGVYEPEPSKETMLRAQFARRAATWEAMIQSRATPKQQEPQSPSPDDPALAPVRNLVVALTELRAAAVVLLGAADKGKAASEVEVKRFHAAQHAAVPLVAGIRPHLAGLFERSDDMAVQLAESTQTLVKAIKLLVPHADGSSGTCPVSKAVIETAREKLAESMIVELPLFLAVTDPRKLQPHPDEDLASGLAILLLLAQAYYKILECAVSLASWAHRLDPQLNHHYFWTINNLTNLLKNHEQLKDFPEKFEPVFPDLNPSTIGGVEWEDMVAPGAEHFLSTVQQYVLSKPVIELREGSSGWIMVEVFKDSISKAVDYAIAYNTRLRQDIKKMFGAKLPSTSAKANDDVPPPSSSNAGNTSAADPQPQESAVAAPRLCKPPDGAGAASPPSTPVAPASQASHEQLPNSVEEGLAHLQAKVEKHRLNFLLCAWAMRPFHVGDYVNCECLELDYYPDKRISFEDADDPDRFLRKNRWLLELYATRALGHFGPGEGYPAGATPGSKGTEEDALLPIWSLDEMDCSLMEGSSNEVLEACRLLVRLDIKQKFRGLLQTVRNVVYADGQSRWYSHVFVRWEYLSQLDDTIRDIKMAELQPDRDGPTHAVDSRAASHDPVAATVDDKTSPPSTDKKVTEAGTGDVPEIGRLLKLCEDVPVALLEKLVAMDQEQVRITRMWQLSMLSKAYARILESVISEGFTALDEQLNSSYLMVVHGLSGLLRNDGCLADFPSMFAPIFPDVAPSTTRDRQWKDDVAPGVEGFLNTVQQYLLSKHYSEPPEGSEAWKVMEFFRPGIMSAIESAANHGPRMREYIRKLLDGPDAKQAVTTPVAPAGHATQAGNQAHNTNTNAATPNANPAAEAVNKLLGRLVAIDTGLLNLCLKMHNLRKANPYGMFFQPPPKLTFQQNLEIQNRIASWTKPVADATKQAMELCNGIARHITGVIESPPLWETNLRTNLRYLSEAVYIFPSLAAKCLGEAEERIGGLGVPIEMQGTQLQDALATINAMHASGHGGTLSRDGGVDGVAVNTADHGVAVNTGRGGSPANGTTPSGWLTVSQAAKQAQVNKGEISRACDSSAIHSVGRKKTRRIDPASLKVWITANQRGRELKAMDGDKSAPTPPSPKITSGFCRNCGETVTLKNDQGKCLKCGGSSFEPCAPTLRNGAQPGGQKTRK